MGGACPTRGDLRRPGAPSQKGPRNPGLGGPITLPPALVPRLAPGPTKPRPGEAAGATASPACFLAEDAAVCGQCAPAWGKRNCARGKDCVAAAIAGPETGRPRAPPHDLGSPSCGRRPPGTCPIGGTKTHPRVPSPLPTRAGAGRVPPSAGRPATSQAVGAAGRPPLLPAARGSKSPRPAPTPSSPRGREPHPGVLPRSGGTPSGLAYVGRKPTPPSRGPRPSVHKATTSPTPWR